MKANPRQEKFARLATIMDATSAAREAGYKDGPGLRVTACKLMKKPHVRAIMAAEQAKITQTQNISYGEIVEGLTEIARDKANPASARVGAYRTLAELWGTTMEFISPYADRIVYEERRKDERAWLEKARQNYQQVKTLVRRQKREASNTHERV